MKREITVIAFLTITSWAFSQTITTPPSGDNQKAKVIQYIGLVKVTIDYSSPDVHAPNGDDRTDHVWGELVPYGMTNLGFGTATASPWRAGANENTTISFSHDVQINNKKLKAGTYGLHLIVEKEKPWTFIFSTNSSSWGSYFYNEQEDALRVEASPENSEYNEFLSYNFEDRKTSSTKAVLKWEKKKIGFTIEVPDINNLYLATIRDELRGGAGFNHLNWVSAATFCVQNNMNLDEALTWAEYAVTGPFVGQEDFTTLQTKASVLTALNKTAEADVVMKKAIMHQTASITQVHQYGRSLIAAGKNEQALEVFKINHEKNPEDKFTTYVGLARGYEAVGDKKNAIKNWEIAIKNIPDNQKQFISVYEAELKKLKG
ncbi:MAG: DUF2911 domain-containing protein [Flammeovirgaceae bacterium]|nr:DUF2911 domain-containing protein [Flammeovirgaceae bacterium]